MWGWGFVLGEQDRPWLTFTESEHVRVLPSIVAHVNEDRAAEPSRFSRFSTSEPEATTTPRSSLAEFRGSRTEGGLVILSHDALRFSADRDSPC